MADKYFLDFMDDYKLFRKPAKNYLNLGELVKGAYNDYTNNLKAGYQYIGDILRERGYLPKQQSLPAPGQSSAPKNTYRMSTQEISEASKNVQPQPIKRTRGDIRRAAAQKRLAKASTLKPGVKPVQLKGSVFKTPVTMEQARQAENIIKSAKGAANKQYLDALWGNTNRFDKFSELMGDVSKTAKVADATTDAAKAAKAAKIAKILSGAGKVGKAVPYAGAIVGAYDLINSLFNDERYSDAASPWGSGKIDRNIDIAGSLAGLGMLGTGSNPYAMPILAPISALPLGNMIARARKQSITQKDLDKIPAIKGINKKYGELFPGRMPSTPEEIEKFRNAVLQNYIENADREKRMQEARANWEEQQMAQLQPLDDLANGEGIELTELSPEQLNNIGYRTPTRMDGIEKIINNAVKSGNGYEGNTITTNGLQRQDEIAGAAPEPIVDENGNLTFNLGANMDTIEDIGEWRRPEITITHRPQQQQANNIDNILAQFANEYDTDYVGNNFARNLALARLAGGYRRNPYYARLIDNTSYTVNPKNAYQVELARLKLANEYAKAYQKEQQANEAVEANTYALMYQYGIPYEQARLISGANLKGLAPMISAMSRDYATQAGVQKKLIEVDNRLKIANLNNLTREKIAKAGLAFKLNPTTRTLSDFARALVTTGDPELAKQGKQIEMMLFPDFYAMLGDDFDTTGPTPDKFVK